MHPFAKNVKRRKRKYSKNIAKQKMQDTSEYNLLEKSEIYHFLCNFVESAMLKTPDIYSQKKYIKVKELTSYCTKNIKM